MKTKKTKPSDFLNYPSRSIFNKSEYEYIALNIMKILTKTGDKFRSISWEEYRKEREKENNFSCGEKIFFNQVRKFCESSVQARTFSSQWD